jgi:hypothetical protein
MKCQNCGAEIGNNKICEFCGSQITADMQKEQEQINKLGCPKCGSSNITFKRENQGEIRGKNSKQIIHRTVGFCKDCGATWYADGVEKKKDKKIWLWVLGWLFIFPLPLTIILIRKKEMNKILKYVIIAIAWIAYFAIGLSGGGNSTDKTNTITEPTTVQSTIEKTSIEIIDGEKGKYGKEIIMSAGTDMEEQFVVYYVPAGSYTVKNLGEERSQVSVYEGFKKNEETGYDEYTNTGDIVVLDANCEGEIDVPDGWFIEIHGAHILLTEK